MNSHKEAFSDLDRPAKQFKINNCKGWISPILQKLPLIRENSLFRGQAETLELERPFCNTFNQITEPQFNLFDRLGNQKENFGFQEQVPEFDLKSELEEQGGLKEPDGERSSQKIKLSVKQKENHDIIKFTFPKQKFLSDTEDVLEEKPQKRGRKKKANKHINIIATPLRTPIKSKNEQKLRRLKKRLSKKKEKKVNKSIFLKNLLNIKVSKLADYWHKSSTLLPSSFRILGFDSTNPNKLSEFQDFSGKGLCHHYEVNQSKNKGNSEMDLSPKLKPHSIYSDFENYRVISETD